MNFLLDKKFLWFVTSFLLLFGLLYYGTIAMIGLAAPGGYYSPFIERYLDYVSWIKLSLLWGVGTVLGLFGISTEVEPGYLIRMEGKRGVIISMTCVGYGVYSFWIAYVLANAGPWVKKLAWVVGGILLLWCINLARITLFLYVINKNQGMPLGIDHHTWFNIFAYLFIFIMIYFFNKGNTPAK
jgi:exosortase/archaeosortase family protein